MISIQRLLLNILQSGLQRKGKKFSCLSLVEIKFGQNSLEMVLFKLFLKDLKTLPKL